jgi:hypothetical protein
MVPGLTGGLAFTVALGADQSSAPCQLSFGGAVANGTVKPDRLVRGQVTPDDTLGIRERKRGRGADCGTFQIVMPAFEFAGALRINRRGTHGSHPAKPDNFLELAGPNLWTVIGDDPRGRLGTGCVRALQDACHVRFGHLGTDRPNARGPD